MAVDRSHQRRWTIALLTKLYNGTHSSKLVDESVIPGAFGGRHRGKWQPYIFTYNVVSYVIQVLFITDMASQKQKKKLRLTFNMVIDVQ